VLKIKNVSARNFMSIGAQTQAVNFENSQLTLVLGHNLDLGGEGSRNGTGKTTIINALSYGLYGEALTNIRRDNLINKTNGKGMMVSVDFEIDDVDYRIERGRKPNVLKLYVNGVEKDDNESQGDSRETQKHIEKIVGFPHNMFKHIIALNTYTEPFLSMKAADQRDMIEQLLGITDLSAKAEVLKEQLKNTKDFIKQEEIEINAIEASNKRIEENITEIESRSRAWQRSHDEKLAELANTLKTLDQLDVDAEISAHKHNQEAAELKDAQSTLESELKQLNTTIERSNKTLEECEHNVQQANEGVCPACGQGTAHLHTHEQYIKSVQDKLSEETKYNKELQTRHTEIHQALEQLGEVPDAKDTFYDSVESAYEHKHNLETLAEQYAQKQHEKNPYTEQIDSLRETALQEVSFDKINELTELREHQEFLYKLLTSKDSFIRRKIIDQNIAYLNQRLAYYLERIGLPHEVEFGSDLGVEITEFGRDLDFDNLSRGERNRLILSISWAFRDIYESLNRPMNLMCVDELIDSGMDSVGVENSLSVLKKMHRDQGKNIMLISHKDELVGRVNNVLTVVKTGGFTEYNTDTEYID
jgi:DNA repair exonuclease SbcCD ATPase subunit